MKKDIRVALVHDWITGMRGGEKCLLKFLELYPGADVYTLIHSPGCTRPLIDAAVTGTSWFQKLPGVRNYYRALLPAFPSAVRSLDIKGYDLIISTSHAGAKNINASPDSFHVSYCFTPMRYIWDQADKYMGALRYPAAPLLSALRSWDQRSSEGVDEFVAISKLVAARIRHFYKRPAAVIYPPVDTSWITPRKPGEAGEAFLYAGALVPYKRVDLVVKAFNKLKLPLWVVGKGPELKKLQRMANSNIRFFGAVSDDEMADYFRRCKALVFPGKEDFGMVPVEVMAAGRPVIALAAGGARETVGGIRVCENTSIDSAAASGVFIDRQHAGDLSALIEAVHFFEKHEESFMQEDCVARAKLFSPQNFELRWAEFIESFGYPASVPEQESNKRLIHA